MEDHCSQSSQVYGQVETMVRPCHGVRLAALSPLGAPFTQTSLCQWRLCFGLTNARFNAYSTGISREIVRY